MNQSDQQSILIRQPQILCVEGDAAGLALLEAVFTPRGYGVVPAGTGLQALEILSKQSVDLILMDAILPEPTDLQFVHASETSNACAIFPLS